MIGMMLIMIRRENQAKDRSLFSEKGNQFLFQLPGLVANYCKSVSISALSGFWG
jgi:hypothetical protein